MEDPRQLLFQNSTDMVGLPGGQFRRRFYGLRQFSETAHLDFDTSGDGYRIYTCKRYIPENNDSGQGLGVTYDDSDLDLTETPALLEREVTPDPRQDPLASPRRLTAAQRQYWRDSQRESQLLPAVEEMEEGTMIARPDIPTIPILPTLPTLPARPTTSPDMNTSMPSDESLQRLMLVGDSLSETDRRRINQLLIGLYEPESPEADGAVPGERIVPTIVPSNQPTQPSPPPQPPQSSQSSQSSQASWPSSLEFSQLHQKNGLLEYNQQAVCEGWNGVGDCPHCRASPCPDCSCPCPIPPRPTSNLSPEAAPFRPKRLNTTNVIDLHTRETAVDDEITFNSTSSIKSGDNANDYLGATRNLRDTFDLMDTSELMNLNTSNTVRPATTTTTRSPVIPTTTHAPRHPDPNPFPRRTSHTNTTQSPAASSAPSTAQSSPAAARPLVPAARRSSQAGAKRSRM